MNSVHQLHKTQAFHVAARMPVATAANGRQVAEGRTLHIVDLENLMGGPSAGFLPMAKAIREFLGLSPGNGPQRGLVPFLVPN